MRKYKLFMLILIILIGKLFEKKKNIEDENIHIHQ